MSHITLKYLLVFVLSIILYQPAISQEIICGLDSPSVNGLNLTSSFSGIQFFDEDLACEPLVLKCNFVIINRDDGTGNMDPNHPIWKKWADRLNRELSRSEDVASCDIDYPLDTKVRLEIDVDTINNSEAWDWYGEANRDNLPSTTRPYAYICPRFDGEWDELESAITTYEQDHFGEINFFFVDNGELVELLESALENSTSPGPYADRFELAGSSQADGCSIYPKSYHSVGSENSYVIPNTFSEFLIRTNFHTTMMPTQAHLSADQVWENFYWPQRLLLLHEMGHNIMNRFHRGGCQRLMNGRPGSSFIDRDDIERLHRTLATTDLHNAVDCSNLSASICPVQIVSDATINFPMSVFGDLIVKKGMVLTVKDTLYLSESSRIIVEENAKLIIDGGKLTSGCGSTWERVMVYGGNDDFDVKFTNGAVVENTSRGAVFMLPPEPWPEIQQWGNGILHAENTTFNNVERIAEFLSWRSLPNSSYIKDCIQNGGKWGVTNWNCQGIEVINNVFNDIQKHCVGTEVGSFLIKGNTFDSKQNDIFYNNTSAGISSLIDSNYFGGLKYGYHARGTTFAQNEISNNNFLTGQADILNDGHNQYRVIGNRLSSDYGSVSLNNGFGIASISSNIFDGNIFGLLVFGENDDYNFFKNCFSSKLLDVYIDGSVSPIIGDATCAANNCFTHENEDGSTILDISGNPNPFTYLLPSDQIDDCRDVISQLPNINTISTCGGSQLPQCTDQVRDSLLTNPCNPRLNVPNLLEAMNLLNGEMSGIEENNLSFKKDIAYINYKNCFDKARGELAQLYLLESKFEKARELYHEDDSNDAKVYIYSSYLIEGDLSSGRNYLKNIYMPSEELYDFIEVQLINLDRLPYGPFYDPSPGELSKIKFIANKDHSYAAYAKALYYTFTGEIISSKIPNLKIGKYYKPTEKKIFSEEFDRVYPNPFLSDLSFDIDIGKISSIRIIGVSGEVMLSRDNLSSRFSVPTIDWPKGVYFIEMSNNGSIMSRKKIIKL